MVTTITAEHEWNSYILEHSGHPLQLWGWGELKARHNWRVERVVVTRDTSVIGGAQLLIRPLPKPFRCLVYVPRGPFGDRANVLSELPDYVQQRFHPTHLLIEPDSEDFQPGKKWRRSNNSILLARTIQLDLTKSEASLLAAMTKKTRQYIRKSSKDGAAIRSVKTRDQLNQCLHVYKQTAMRANFALHQDSYYHDLHSLMGESSVIFGAYEGDTLLAFVWLIVSKNTAFELYGGMTDRGQQLRANYILKWHAITKCKEWGIATYDVNGLLNDGVSTFKQGFASHETPLAGSFDYPLSPMYYVWSKMLPTLKTVVRSVKRR